MSDPTPLTIDEETKFRESVAALRRVEDENGCHAMQWTNHAAERLLATLDSVRLAALSTTPAPLDEAALTKAIALSRASTVHWNTLRDSEQAEAIARVYRDAISTTPAPLDAALERLDEDDIDYCTDPAGPTALEPNEPELWVRYAALAREYAKP